MGPDEDAPTLRPMLVGKVGIPAGSARMLVEPKWDGVRAIVTVQGGRVGLASRNDRDVTAAYPELAAPPDALAGRRCVLDAEVVALGDSGGADFGRLQRRMHVRHPSPRLVADVPVILVVFDVLWLDGELLITSPQERRRWRLEELGIGQPPWVTSPLLDLAPGPELLDACRDAGIEGFVLKKPGAAYEPGRRSDAWAKVKCTRTREFVVGGWLPGKGSREGSLGSLALGAWDAPAHDLRRRLLFVGMAGSGLSHADLEAFRRASGELGRSASPFAGAIPRDVRYLEPVLVAEVVFSEVTAAGTLRHPVLRGFRTDIRADDVTIDAELEVRAGRVIPGAPFG